MATITPNTMTTTFDSTQYTSWEYNQLIDTTGTGDTVAVLIPAGVQSIYVTLRVTSTASCTLYFSNNSTAVIVANSATDWAISGAAVTGGAVTATAFAVAPRALKVTIGTALAGVQACLSICGRI